ncbi:hypothetical protein NDU88_007957 [Pleurodeles waltl]|uniref:Uncharacterized protein n=1 Tax=Pleurodeles waltl TaxID=8319 RepID=A0AAV7NUS9_PLEWA|nr:hypothetical protein NDU88_007957 [Pleurodeles waltl]
MVANAQRGAKRSHTVTLLEALMLRVDTVDQVMASLRAQPSAPESVPSDQTDKSGRRKYLPGRHSPQCRRRCVGRRRAKVARQAVGNGETHPSAGDRSDVGFGRTGLIPAFFMPVDGSIVDSVLCGSDH